MLHIQKVEEPLFLIDFKKKYPKKDYDSAEFAEYRPVLKSELIKEQKCLCAYCCGKITEDKSHNEHIEPRHPGKYASNRTLDYNNIVASCNNSETCGKKKGNKYDADKFVSPLQKDCEEKFTYYPNGQIVGDEYTIELLNLNAYELKNARRAVMKQLQGFDKDAIDTYYMNEEDGQYLPYYNVIKWYRETM
ncbi:retron system putative HNH endonuclease [uncultured Eubacterium sp.]|uniref:retron system putative HNH endonuclease n=1 Tax=uncultured Eubacterium sp. TaxID=165185 RepID=UPI0025DE8415|nr:retron system putative HNH endonuclease [uncultured Eubacterium sp.]